MLLIGRVGTRTSVERWAMVWRDVGVRGMGVRVACCAARSDAGPAFPNWVWSSTEWKRYCQHNVQAVVLSVYTTYIFFFSKIFK